MPATLILFNKPYGVLSQFRQDDNNDFATLSDFFYQPQDKNLRVAGRLDATSEGLLLLTDNGKLNQFLTNPSTSQNPKQGKTYWVQVEGSANDEQLQALQNGVLLKDGKTLPAIVKKLDENEVLQTIWQAPDNIAKRAKNSWLSITIFEGKNRQIRRMTAHVGLPCLRLIRMAHGDFTLQNLSVGEYQRLYLTNEKLNKLFNQKPNHRK